MQERPELKAALTVTRCDGAVGRIIVLKGTTMLRLAPLLAVTCLTAHGFQQDTGREKDVYAIYSLMLTNPQTSHGADDNKLYLIAERIFERRSPTFTSERRLNGNLAAHSRSRSHTSS